MRTYVCTNCGYQIQRPTQPFNCPQCGRQAVNLFRPAAAGAPQGPYPQQPGAGGYPPGPPGYPQTPGQQGYPQSPGQQGYPQTPGQPPYPQPPGYPQQQGQPGYPQAPGAAPQVAGGYPQQYGPVSGPPGQGQAGGGYGPPQQGPPPAAPGYGYQAPPGQQQPAGPWRPPPAQGQPAAPQQPSSLPPAPGPPRPPGGALPGGGIRPPQFGRPPVPGQTGFAQQPPGAEQPGAPQQPPPPAAPGQYGRPEAVPGYPPPGGQPPVGGRPPVGSQPPMGSQPPVDGQPQVGPATPVPLAGGGPGFAPGPPRGAPPQPPAPQGPPPQPPESQGSPPTPGGFPFGQAQRHAPKSPEPPRADRAPQQPLPPSKQPPHTAAPQPPQQPASSGQTPTRPGAPHERPQAERSPAPTHGPVAKQPPPAPPSGSPRPKGPSESSRTKPSVEPRPETPRPSRPTRKPAPPPATDAPPKATDQAKRPEPERAAPPKPAPKVEKRPEPVPVPPKPRPKPVRPEQFAWAYPEDPPVEEGVPLRAPPAVDAAGRVFLHFQDRLLALKPSENKPVIEWEYVTGARVPGPIMIALDGSLRLHAADGFLHAVFPDDGKQLWTAVFVGEPLGYAAPLVDAVGNTYISSLDGGLLRVDEDGRCDKARPYFRSRQKLNSTGIIHRGVLYIGSEEGYVFAIELGDQRGRNRFDHALDQGHAGWFINSALALAEDGTIIVAGRDDNLYGFTPGGATAWKTAMPGQMLGSPVLDARGHVYVGIAQSQRGQPSRGKLLSIDGNSHKIRWQADAGDAVESTPVVGDDGMIYFGDNAGLIHAVDLSGAPKWKAKVHAPVRSAGMLVGPGKLAFGLDDETLVVLNCSSQKLPDAGWPKLAWTPRHGGPV